MPYVYKKSTTKLTKQQRARIAANKARAHARLRANAAAVSYKAPGRTGFRMSTSLVDPRAGFMRLRSSYPKYNRTLKRLGAFGPGTKSYECGQRYQLAALDPFNEAAKGACLPIHPIRDSMKYQATASGVFQTSTAVGFVGKGWLLLAPTAVTDGAATRCPSIYMSNATATDVGPVDVNLSVVGGTTSVPGSHTEVPMTAPFTHDQVTDGSPSREPTVQCRVIVAAVRVRYMGRADEAGGVVYGYVSPNHQNLNGQNENDIISKANVIKFDQATSGEWLQLSALAQTPREMEYAQEVHNDSGGNLNEKQLAWPWSDDKRLTSSRSANGAVCMGLWFSTPVASKWEYEVIYHCEAVGDATNTMQSPNASNVGAVHTGQQLHANQRERQQTTGANSK